MSFGKALGACWLFLTMIASGLIWAAEDRNTLKMSAQIQPRASLSLERTHITFAGPDGQQLISSQEGPVQLTVKVRANAIKSASLNMLAESDLEGLGSSIPIQQVEWTASGLGTVTGILSRTQEQMVERYTTSGVHQTRVMFALRNNGNQPPGAYATFVNFTLTSP